ncbi:Cof-type HAD-IIB family hydrolase [Clostridium aminobutyricum]|uniref:HAD family phosphatase n=1 Tax=Clostridium aminobutyricum TaxID=33953 RepID=A0A939IFW7_CLOAM|nr:Cof-type HAD-IIB family hydrolase [Clostridium aminobutyricum]MBN7772030.1 HAD family phosphatase [Clostridium aminobutyricum]
MAIKLIALDLDGTTLNSLGKLSDVNRQALNAATANGVHVVIATGRVRSALPEDILNVSGIEYAITSNGAAITDLRKEKVVYQNCIASEAITGVYELLSQYPFMVEIFLNGKAFVEKHIYDNIDKLGFTPKHTNYIKQTRLPYENVLTYMVQNRSIIENININFANQEDRIMMRERLKQLHKVTITTSFDHNLEIGGETTSKADALRNLCTTLGVNEREIMACGDSPNDEVMMSVAGLPVAMGNAKPSVKEISKYITGTNDENGVAQAIHKFVLG